MIENGYNAGEFDAIVIGAGHAGCEAALALARMGHKALCLTLHHDAVALLACNPSIGGSAKGHLAREVDALGGEMALVADATLIQQKTLNTSKGPAIRAYRAQVDRLAYQRRMLHAVTHTDNLLLRQGEAAEILTNNHNETIGVKLTTNIVYHAKAVIVATGVYLNSRVLCGEDIAFGGPSGLSAATKLTQSLQNHGFTIQRFKTGTPPRIDGRTIDYNRVDIACGDKNPYPFSFLTEELHFTETPCHQTATNPATHEIIRANLHRAPMFTGVIEGVGARYCPSIEDKIVRFAGRQSHTLFLEPEGEGTCEVYVQGFSTSLPEDVQQAALRTVKGLENAHIMRAGYAIEYDCIDARALTRTLACKDITGLYFAGQINGTSGYEEAAAQGLLAGYNAGLWLQGRPPLIIGREEGYLGVLVDDLTVRGAPEPYRMMTARAEHRLLLGQDTADLRLTQKLADTGLCEKKRFKTFTKRKEALHAAEKILRADRRALEQIKQNTYPASTNQAIQQACDAIRYEGYIARQQRQAA
ncbi:MAG: tRNA uridine-5-carboxymethylaminomethyl(34) synthesis enzyme MnmG, partial [Clostridia bacterium]|nr:tRNA uridine-5-carboxymethylaminomethyl(34) synthesis enzyme MnmG [Clostridia bacterium]